MVSRGVAGAVLLSAVLGGALGCTRAVDGDVQPDAAAVAVVRDENQIRALVDEQNTYAADFDFAKLAQTKCAKYRDATAAETGPSIPAMTDLVTPDLISAPGAADLLRKLLAEKFPAAPAEVIDAVVDSVVAQDEAAYQAAMRDLMKSLISVKVTKVDNIEIRGDQATADLTITTKTGDEPPADQILTNKYVREDGKWRDCNVPSAGR